MTQCTNCGIEIPDGSRFCAECGAAQMAPGKSEPPKRPRRRWTLPKVILWLVLLVSVAATITLGCVFIVALFSSTGRDEAAPTEEPIAHATATVPVTIVAAITPSPTATPRPTDTPGPMPTTTATSVPTLTSAPDVQGVATTGVNLRSGPGTQYDRIGGLAADDLVEIRARTSNGEWYQVKLPSGSTAWVAAAYIATQADASEIPTAIPTARPTSTPTDVPAQPTPTAAPPRKGWLCDYDRTGSIRLWTAAAMDATVKNVVGTCIGCCLDVVVYGQDLANGILFYWIDVGRQSGWVDVDYLYWRKPRWATN